MLKAWMLLSFCIPECLAHSGCFIIVEQRQILVGWWPTESFIQSIIHSLLYTRHLRADGKIQKEGRRRTGPEGKRASHREDGEARRSLCPFLFLPDSGLLLLESSMPVKTEDWKSRELMLLILCITLGVLLLGSLISMSIILLRAKGKYGRCGVLGAPGKAQDGKKQA